MASRTLSLFFSLLIFIICVHGRTLQTNYTSKSVDVSHAFSFATTYRGKTNYSDVLGLYAWVSISSNLEEDNPDPCLPPTWTWIECNSDASPRIIALDLSDQLVLGEIPDFSSMDALQTIDIYNNILTGSIPSFLGTFPGLKELNLASNYFSGLIPDSLACNKNLNMTVDGDTGLYVSSKCAALWTDIPSPPPADINPGNPSPPPADIKPDNPSPSADTNTNTAGFSTPATAGESKTTTTTKKSNLPAILGTTIPLFSVLWIAFGVFMVYRHKAKTAAAIAQASNQGPGDTHGNIPTEERPMNDLPIS